MGYSPGEKRDPEGLADFQRTPPSSGTKTHLEVNLAMDVKHSKKGFSQYISSKRNTKGNIGLLLNGTGNLMTKDMEKEKALTAFCALVFTNSISLQESQAPEILEQSLEQGKLTLSRGGSV